MGSNPPNIDTPPTGFFGFVVFGDSWKKNKICVKHNGIESPNHTHTHIFSFSQSLSISLSLCTSFSDSFSLFSTLGVFSRLGAFSMLGFFSRLGAFSILGFFSRLGIFSTDLAESDRCGFGFTMGGAILDFPGDELSRWSSSLPFSVRGLTGGGKTLQSNELEI